MQDPVKAWAISLAALVAAVLLRWFLDPLMGDALPLVTLFGAVAVAAWAGGYVPAIVVAVLGYEEALAVHNNNTALSAANSVPGPLPPVPFVAKVEDIGPLIACWRWRTCSAFRTRTARPFARTTRRLAVVQFSRLWLQHL